MKLSYLVNELRSRINEIGHYNTFIIKELAGNKGKKEKFAEIPIIDVVLDDVGEEINIIPNENPSEKAPFTVAQLLEKLDQFMPKAADYHIFVSHPTANLGKKYAPRIDVPVVAHGIDESGSSFALIERSAKTNKKT
jgi:hypothetical protein